MNSYIVRIYRYEEGNPVLAGIVENPEDGERKPFATLDELSKMLTQMQKDVPCRGKGKKTNSGIEDTGKKQ